VLWRLDRDADARALFESEIDRRRAALGERQPAVADALEAHGRRLLEHEAAVESEAALRAAIEIREFSAPDDRVALAAARCVLGRALTAQRRFADAEQTLLEAEQRLSQAGDPAASRAHEALVELYVAWHRETDAKRWRAPSP